MAKKGEEVKPEVFRFLKPEKVGADPEFRPTNAMLHTPTMEQGSFEITQRVGDDAIPLFDPVVVAAEADWGSVPATPSQPCAVRRPGLDVPATAPRAQPGCKKIPPLAALPKPHRTHAADPCPENSSAGSSRPPSFLNHPTPQPKRPPDDPASGILNPRTDRQC